MNEKQGQFDTSKLTEGLRNAGGQLSGWWGAIPDEAKKTMLRTAIGAGTGGLLAHTAAGGFGDKEYRPGISPALLGALLGGTTGMAAPLGMKMLKGEIKFKPKEETPLLDKGVNKLVDTATSHAGTTAGLLGSGIAYNRMAPTDRGIADMARRGGRHSAALDKARMASKPDIDQLRRMLFPTDTSFSPKRFPKFVLKNPRRWAATAATMVAAPVLGALADRYIYGRHE